MIDQLHNDLHKLGENIVNRKFSFDELTELGNELDTAMQHFFQLMEMVPTPRDECRECTPRSLQAWHRLPQNGESGSHRNAPLTADSKRLIEIAAR